MTKQSYGPLLDRLWVILSRLASLQDDLINVMTRKLEAMRGADVDAMTSAARDERQIIAQFDAADAERIEVAARLADQIGAPCFQQGKGVSLRLLAERLTGVTRDQLLRQAAELREKMLRVGELNRIVEIVSREMLSHFKTLFSIMAQSEEDGLTYSPGGEMGRTRGASVLDAVG